MLIKIQNSAKKDLKKLENSTALKLLNAIKHLQNFPNVANIKKLKNHQPAFRLRVGDYRILFDVEDDLIIVARIKHRKEAY
jgi:mRNA interferase RelE/StbE